MSSQSSDLPKQMRCVIIEKKGAPFTATTRHVPSLKEGQVLVQVKACGVCGGDHVIKDGLMPNASYPRIPGHEVAGVVVAVGPNAKRWKVGDRVGRGWAGGHCFECLSCRKGLFVHCSGGHVTGLDSDGGMSEYMVAPWQSLLAIPAGMSFESAAPLTCAGVTTYNSIRNLKLSAGSWIGVQGVGGLGHLAVQFAAKMGYRVVVLTSSADKAKLAKELGAHHVVDTKGGAQATVGKVMELTGGEGLGAMVATSPSGRAMSDTIPTLGVNGMLLILGAGPDPITAPAGLMIHHARCIRGWMSGSPQDSEETLQFAQEFGVRVIAECFELEKAGEVYDKMNANQLRFRGVLFPNKDDIKKQ